MFDALLGELLGTVPGARGAVFCDRDGETVVSVGASGRHDPGARDDFDLKVTGAQLAPCLEDIRRTPLGAPQELVLEGRRERLLVRILPDGYYLVLCLRPGALAARAMVHLRRTALRVAEEM